MAEFEDRLRAARAYAGEISQAELAARIEPPVSESTIKRLETGRKLAEEDIQGWARQYGRICLLPAGFFFAPFERLDEEWAPAEEQLDALRATVADLSESNQALRESNARLEQVLHDVSTRVDSFDDIKKMLAQWVKTVDERLPPQRSKAA